MPERRWGAIASGATFESLATTLVFFEDPSAALFGRRGKDGGQDARSGDGTLVYQAKHHQSASARTAIADAKSEAAKIQRYRLPEHERAPEWICVSRWRLVTNAEFNPRDRREWDDEVVPLFASLGLEATFWERANLDALLDKHPEVDRAYFGNETRVLLTLPEVRELLPIREPFLRRPELGRFVGRHDELDSIRSFLRGAEPFLVLHGAGGVGKTRLLVEAGERIASDGDWQVFWANVASISSGGRWFDAIVPERSTLLIVDDPQDEYLLRQLEEQLGRRTGRTSGWKVAVTVRSPNETVVRFLRSPRTRPNVKELRVEALSSADAEAMCFDLLASGSLGDVPETKLREASRALSERFGCHPVWLTLAVNVLEDKGNLSIVPQTAHDLAELYLGEVSGPQNCSSRARILGLLRWVALLGTVNRKEGPDIAVIAAGADVEDEIEVQKELNLLVNRGALVCRGAHGRLLELKPNVLRDHVLLTWLSSDVGDAYMPRVPSREACRIVATMSEAIMQAEIPRWRVAALISLARTERLLHFSGHAVPILDQFFVDLHERMSTVGVERRIGIANTLAEVAPFRPNDVARIVTTLRTAHVDDEVVAWVLGTRVVKRDDLILNLAWPISQAAIGAFTSDAQALVVEEMCSLVVAEAEICVRQGRKPRSNGKRAADLLATILEGAPHIPDGFEEAALSCARRLLNDLRKRVPGAAQEALLRALVHPLVQVHRTQIWNTESEIRTRHVLLGSESPMWMCRDAVVGELRSFTQDGATPLESRIAGLKALLHAHQSLLEHQSNDDGEPREHVRRALADDLVWMERLMLFRPLEVAELVVCRRFWRWQLEFDQEPGVRESCERLESLFAQNELVREFEPLVGRADWESRRRHVDATAGSLANGGEEAIWRFVERATAYMTDDESKYPFAGVAWQLGSLAPDHGGVRDFARKALAAEKTSLPYRFALDVIEVWLATVRSSCDATCAADLVSELIALRLSDSDALDLVERLYGAQPVPASNGKLTLGEHELLRALAPRFAAAGRSAKYLHIIGCTLQHNWQEYRRVVEGVLEATSAEQTTDAIRALLGSLHWPFSSTEAPRAPEGFASWVFDRIVQAPDIDGALDNAEWHIGALFEREGRVSISRLLAALSERVRQHEREPTFDVVGTQIDLSRYVVPLESADEETSSEVVALRAMVGFAESGCGFGFVLPKMLRRLDPHGVCVPAEAVRRICAATTHYEVRDLVEIAVGFGVGSSAWRTISRAALAHVTASDVNTRAYYYFVIANVSMRSWMGQPGKVPDLFVADVASARAALESEADPLFVDFWKWRLARAERELHEREEQAKEERGD